MAGHPLESIDLYISVSLASTYFEGASSLGYLLLSGVVTNSIHALKALTQAMARVLSHTGFFDEVRIAGGILQLMEFPRLVHDAVGAWKLAVALKAVSQMR